MASDSTSASSSGATKYYTRAEVAKHYDSKEPWIIIQNCVYDVTRFLNEHPGGEEVLLEQAGRDASEPFDDVGHSGDAKQLMLNYKIGELVEEDRIEVVEKKAKDWGSGSPNDDDNSSWRSWLIPVALGILVTLVYRYLISAH